MTATVAPPTIKTPMLPFLQGTHEQWLREVRDVLHPARAPEAGTWMRWRAIEYLEGSFARRFERERNAVLSLHERLTGDHAGHLWAGGELLQQLVRGVGSRVGLCQRAERFSPFALTLQTALEYWCREVEESLGSVRWGDVPPESRSLFEVIGFDEY